MIDMRWGLHWVEDEFASREWFDCWVEDFRFQLLFNDGDIRVNALFDGAFLSTSTIRYDDPGAPYFLVTVLEGVL